MMRFKTFLASVTFLAVTSLFILGFAVFQVNAQEFRIEAEDFVDIKGESWQVITPPATAPAHPDSTPRHSSLIAGDGSMIQEYDINEASGDFIGNLDRSGANNDWVKYVFNVPVAGDWYIWAKAIAPSLGDNSWFVGIDITDDKAVSEDNDDMNIWDVHETDAIAEGDDAPLRERVTIEWVWFPLCSRTGNPFPGTEIEQYGPNPTPLSLTAGEHTFHFAWREHSFIDVIAGTMDMCNPNTNPECVTAVELQGKLTTTWGQLKHAR